MGVDVTFRFTVDEQEPVDLSVSRTQDKAYLTIGKAAKIRLLYEHLEALRDQLPGVLADLDMMAEAYGRVEDAGARAQWLERDLRERADTADAAGERERAGELRGMADQLTAAVAALDRTAEALTEAALATDSATEDAKALLDKQIARGTRLAEDQPATQGVGR